MSTNYMQAVLAAAADLTKINNKAEQERAAFEAAYIRYASNAYLAVTGKQITAKGFVSKVKGQVPFAVSEATMVRDLIVGQILAKKGADSLSEYTVTADKADAKFLYWMKPNDDSGKRESTPCVVVARPDGKGAVGLGDGEVSLATIVRQAMEPGNYGNKAATPVGKERIKAAIRKSPTAHAAIDALVAFIVGYAKEQAEAKAEEAKEAEEAAEQAEAVEAAETAEEEAEEAGDKTAADLLSAGTGLLGAAVKAAEAGKVGDAAQIAALIATYEAALRVIGGAVTQ